MNSKKWLALLLSAAMLVPVGVAACDKGDDGGDKDDGKDVKTLAAPQVTLDGNVLSWAAVENAESYIVYLKSGQTTQTVSEQTGLTYTIPQTEAGDYEYSVVAQNKTLGIKSGRSVKVTYTIAPDTSVLFSGKIYVVGDSTVSAFSDNYYLPRYGYGTQLYNYINCDPANIRNLALSGRSSLSFLKEANYTTLKTSISEGDYLIIGFGHNDEKSDDPTRYTSPVGDKTTEGSFQKTLYDNYIKLAKDKGATPILCTPIVRYDSTGAYTGTVVHNTSAGDYVKAIKDLGADTGTTVIDLTSITKELYMQDNNAAQYFHAFTSYKGEKPDEKPNGRDSTHLNMYGAKTVAYNLAQALLSTELSIKDSIKTNTYAPYFSYDFPLAIKTDYIRPPYNVFDENSETAAGIKLTEITTGDTTSKWYGSAMGNLGGDKANNFTKTYADGIFTVGASEAIGKLEDKTDGTGTDGFAAAFTQVDVNKNFTVNAHVKVKTIPTTATSQCGFGIMLRDDIYINKNEASLSNNYVAAGVLGNSKAIFCRNATEDGTRITAESNSVSVAVNSEFDMSIVRLGQKVTVTVTVVGGATYTKDYTDFDFVAVDNDYMYICLFATRGDVVEFSNVTFEITGDAMGA